MLKADLHIHTRYSMDCDTEPERIIDRCLELGINCIAVADHGTTDGAIHLQRLAPFRVIVAEEILTPHGEIMGMFLQKTIPSGISIEQAIAEIRNQGGLVNISHPFDTMRGLKLNDEEMTVLAEQIDAVEVFNAREPFRRPSVKALAFACRHNLPSTAGSDAHTIGEIGNAYVEIPEFNGPEDFLPALSRGRVIGHRTSLLVHLATTWARLKSMFAE